MFCPRLRRLIPLVFAWLPLALAQTEAPSADQPAAVGNAVQGYVIDKIMGIVGPSEPSQLTEKKRFHLYIFSVAGPVPLLAEAAGAGFSQWVNTPKKWGQGWDAYGERYESNLAYNGLRQTITYGTSALFHEDNRYFPSHKQGVWARAGYAVRHTVTARHPDASQAFSISSVVGVLGASAASSIWGPRSWEGVDGIGRNAGISFATTAAFNVVREFLPDLLHRPQKQLAGR
jgi:hypothetical protein